MTGEEDRGGAGGNVPQEGARAQGPSGGGGAGGRRRDRRGDRTDRPATVAVWRLRGGRAAHGGTAPAASMARSAAPRPAARAGLSALSRALWALRRAGGAGPVGRPVGAGDDRPGPGGCPAGPEAVVGGGRGALRPRLEDRGGDHPRGCRSWPQAAPLAAPARDRDRRGEPRQGPALSHARL